MEAIFLNERETAMARVYPKRISEALSLKSYCKAEVEADPEAFSDVKYIFSTWGMTKLTEAEIKRFFPSLECVFYAAGSVQAFARPFLNCGVKVFSAWAANAVPVAEYTVSQIVLANKGFFRAVFDKKRDSAREKCAAYPGNYGVKVGIVGAGMIGKLVIKMLKSYDLEIMVFDPFLPDEKAAELGVTKCSLEKLFCECFVVSNHLANNEQTKKMINYTHLSSLMPNAVFINTGRGAQVDEEALIKVLSERPDITALLDVTEPEPPVDGSPLYSLPNCILTPHIAGSSGNEVHRMAEYMKDEFERYIKGEPCKYRVTEKMLETMA